MRDRSAQLPELLAPAGSPEALRAAVENGADAVYLGVQTLNARRGAENFTLETLPETCHYVHLNGARVYLTANVVVLQHELAEALDLIDRAWAAGIDAVIVQDLGLIRMLSVALPHVRVHASTQISAHNSLTLDELARLGVARVTLARELSLREIGVFASRNDIEVESFVHGALCMCYSGQCLMSSVIGRRSANRGLCAQPCRLPYELVDEAGRVAETLGAHLLSPRDLAGIARLPEFVSAGVDSLKIEGRMKSAEYVALVTSTYRAALDRVAADAEGFSVRDGERHVLEEAFSRGFTEGYLVGERGNAMMSYRRPNNRGVPVGRVVAVSDGSATVDLATALDAEDTLEFWTSAGRFTQAAGPLRYEGAERHTAPARARVTLAVQESVAPGDRVFRVRNAALSAAAKRTFAPGAEEDSVPLSFSARLIEGEPLRIEVRDADGVTGAAEGPVVEAARTKALGADEVMEHVGRLGGMQYRAESWSIDLSPGVGIGYSALHRVRRDAIEAYEAELLKPWSGRGRAEPQLSRVLGAPQKRLRRSREEVPLLVAAVEDAEVVQACLGAGADLVHVPAYALKRGEPLGPRIIPLLPRIAHDAEIPRQLSFAEPGVRVVAGTLGTLAEAKRRGAEVEAHWSLNALNSLSVQQLAKSGASFVWLSPELSGRQIAELAALSPVPLGVAVYGRQELMVTEHCLLMAEGECTRGCAACERRARRHVLRDRKGYEFPVHTDPTGRSHVYNSVPLDLTAALPELLSAGVGALRMDLCCSSAEEVAKHVRLVRAALASAFAGAKTAKNQVERTTSGHFFRGIT
ncbi:MAG: DUF3656 domain-containing protein [Coriobacteriia bacterium]